MILTKTSTLQLPAMADQPRRVHNAGVWFADDDRTMIQMLSHPAWVEMGRPEQIEVEPVVVAKKAARKSG